MLAVLDAIAARQPIGASALARLLDADKSAVQRSIVTLAEAGWISQTAEHPVRWELSAHLFTLAHLPRSADELRARARAALEQLRDETGETAFLAIPDIGRFVVIEVVESRNVLRMVPRIGEIIATSQSATGRILLPFFSTERQEALLGHKPNESETAEFAACRQRGYGVSADEVVQGATTVAAPVFDSRGQPLAAIVITGPSERLPPASYDGLGALLRQSAANISRGTGVFADG